jgi:ubiquinone/menaquinone biosynthesis C-methylase UbiE
MKNVRKSTQKAYDLWSSTYDDSPHILHELERNLIIDLIDPRPGDKILDAGCGTGKYTFEFSRNGADVTGVDFSEKIIEIAKKKNPEVKFVLADLKEKIPFNSKFFGKINCSQVFQHIEQPCSVLIEFKRLIKKNGIAVFSVTHPDMDWEYYRKNIPKNNFDLSNHAVFYKHEFFDYIEAIKKARLNIVKMQSVPITGKVKKFFEPKIFQKVEGKFLGLVFKLTNK